MGNYIKPQSPNSNPEEFVQAATFASSVPETLKGRSPQPGKERSIRAVGFRV